MLVGTLIYIKNLTVLHKALDGSQLSQVKVKCYLLHRYLFWVVHHQSILVLSCVCHSTCNHKINIMGLKSQVVLGHTVHARSSVSEANVKSVVEH